MDRLKKNYKCKELKVTLLPLSDLLRDQIESSSSDSWECGAFP